MKNFLDSGAVLPHGLLHADGHGMGAGFNKTYRNTQLRLGTVIKVYLPDDKGNRSKLAPEYDVAVIEQNEDRGSTSSVYRNCLSIQGLGSIADFFEANLRVRTKKEYKPDTHRLKDQNGAAVLVLCLDGTTDKAMIIGGFPHPNRKTTLTEDVPHLEGEYNGINIKVEKDGSTSLTFKGATDADGALVDKESTPTKLSIEKDGSFQLEHKTVSMRLDKNGKTFLDADSNISNTTKKDFNVIATENINTESTKNTSMKMADWMVKASGGAQLEVNKLAIKADSEIKIEGSQFAVEASSMAKIKASTITLDGMVALGGDGGQPVLLLATQFIGTGNLGIPVMSTAIAGYATKVTAT